MAPDPANFLHQLLKKNLAEKNMAPDPANYLHQLPQKESSGNYRSRQLLSSSPSKRIQRKIIWLQIPPTLFISSLKRIRWKIIWLQIPPTFVIGSLKKNPAKNYMAPDPANFVHELPQKESGGKLYSSRSRQLFSSTPSKRIRRKIIWLQIPPTFCISQLCS